MQVVNVTAPKMGLYDDSICYEDGLHLSAFL